MANDFNMRQLQYAGCKNVNAGLMLYIKKLRRLVAGAVKIYGINY
jgi:hypothetical protein